jgi:transposase-like protein
MGRRIYSVEEKLLAIELILSNSGAVQSALEHVQAALDAPNLNRSTLNRWWNARAELDGASVASPSQHIKKETPPDVRETASEGEVMPTQALQQILQQEDGSTRERVKSAASVYWAGIMFKMLERAGDKKVIGEMKGKDAVTSAAIAMDKLMIALSLPPEIVERLPGWIEKIERAGYPPIEFLDRVINGLNETS